MSDRLHVSDIRRLYAERFADIYEAAIEAAFSEAISSEAPRWRRNARKRDKYWEDKSARKRLVMDKAMTLEAA